ncbi:MAG TPA: class I SAM-dependent methyltransferase [Planctomycetota bacterium]|nr:class I SAM-dependent methyltransferase [Planctomycetota bacterium]
MKGANERYHDRIAPRYDDVYRKDAYWRHYFDVGWRRIKRRLPSDLSHPVLDAGCGTGLYGLELLKSGFRVVFSDLSQKMLDRAEEKAAALPQRAKASFVKADLQDLAGLDDGAFAAVVAQGDPLSFVADPREAVRAIARVLRPGGFAAVSVDSRFGGVDVFLKRGPKASLDETAAFLRTGAATWLADDRDERFPTHAFTPDELRKLGARAGLETLEIIGKTLFDLRNGHPWIDDPATRRRLLELEEEFGDTELALGRAHHLQAIWRKPGGP